MRAFTDTEGDSWTTGKTLRLVLFRGGKGDDLRYAHASSANVADEEYPWVRFDIDVRIRIGCESN